VSPKPNIPVKARPLAAGTSRKRLAPYFALDRFSPMEIILRRHWTKLNLAAESGDPEAQREVGYYYEFGAKDRSGNVLATASLATAMKWYQASATQGNSGAQSALSTILSSGGEIAQDFPRAIHWAKRAVAQGDSSAAFNLGTIYRDLGKPKLAFRWYQRAGTMGDTDAFLQIGLCYLFGFGTEQDFDSALSAFGRIIASDPATSCQRSKENARYWISVLRLIRGPRTKTAVAQVRSLLEIANADDDHEQANELLNLIGKNCYLHAV